MIKITKAFNRSFEASTSGTYVDYQCNKYSTVVETYNVSTQCSLFSCFPHTQPGGLGVQCRAVLLRAC
jgi:hypothetical protein